MMERKRRVNKDCYIGISILFEDLQDGGGISRSYFVKFDFSNDIMELLPPISEVYENEKLIGFEDIFHVTIGTSLNEFPVLGKSYLEPVDLFKLREKILDRDNILNILKEKNSQFITLLLIFSSEDLNLAISCYSVMKKDELKNHLTSNKLSKVFNSEEFKNKLVKESFDHLKPSDMEFEGIENLYRCEDFEFGNRFNFLTLYNPDISNSELLDYILSRKEINTSILECREWLEAI